MRLRDLEPQFVRLEVRPCHVGAPGCNTLSEHTEHEFWVSVDTLAEADGISLLCPKCFLANGGVGTHSVLCWRPKISQHHTPRPGRWEFEGTGYDDLTLRAGSSSVLLTRTKNEATGKLEGCGAHFFIEAGAVRLTP